VDVRQRSFDAAADASKLLITLSTGALGVGLAVLNVEIGKSATLTPVSVANKLAIGAALIILVASLGMGVWTQLAVTHVLSDAADQSTPPDVWDRRITLPFQLQIGAFLVGVATFVAYGIVRLAA
jgi:hypothetical protein